jgi:hypothetical protein
MLKPQKPIKPKSPTVPLEFLTTRNLIHIDEKSYSIKDLLDKAPAGTSIDDIVFEGVYYSGNDYGDNCGYGLSAYYCTTHKNTRYELDQIKYDKELKKYNKKLEDFNLKIALYDFKIKKYEDWLNSEETYKLKKSLNKAEAEVKKLKKKLKIK